MTTSPIFIAIIGTGGVGKAVISQLTHLTTTLSSLPSPIHLSPVLLARSTKMLLSPDFRPLDLSTWETSLSTSPSSLLPLPEIIDLLAAAPGKVVFIDNTSSQPIADSYPSFLRRGISVVTPNKKAFSSGLGLWKDIFSAATSSRDAGLVYHESSVGAGLPVISTLKDLVTTGDSITKIEGVFSGSLSFLFNNFSPVSGQGGVFSEEIKKAKELGYTEPDPRDDLGGMDVARKLTICARLAGLLVEGPGSFPVQSLIPAELQQGGSVEEFMEGLPKFADERMGAMRSEAEKEGKVLRYVGSIDVPGQKVEVKLEKYGRSEMEIVAKLIVSRYDKGHPIATLKGSDNIISFSTKRFLNTPLIIQGAGAGADVTAFGVTSDLLKVVERLSRAS